MAMKTITISKEAYERLRSLKKDDKSSFSDVILAYYPKRKKISEVLKGIGANPELADSIEHLSNQMRRDPLSKVEF